MACPACGCKTVYQFDDEDDPGDDRMQRCAACGEVFDLDDHADEDEDDNQMAPTEKMEKFAALKQAKEAEGYAPDGYWGADQPKCPHCGEVCDVSENEWWRLYEEGEHEVTCPQCDGDFSVSTRVSYSFSTDEQYDEDHP